MHELRRNYRLGDKYAEILSEGIKDYPNIQKYSFANNRISSKGADFLIRTMSNFTKAIDFSSNHLGSKGCQDIAEFLGDSKFKQ